MTETDIRRLDGVFLSTEDAETLAQALAYCEDALIKTGRQWTPHLRRLRSALAGACVSRTGGSASKFAGSATVPSLSGHEFVDTTTAAQLLGCTPSNVRDRARRGTLPAVQIGGRWFVSTIGLHR